VISLRVLPGGFCHRFVVDGNMNLLNHHCSVAGMCTICFGSANPAQVILKPVFFVSQVITVTGAIGSGIASYSLPVINHFLLYFKR
jgi:hypothetical protein